MWSKWIGGKAYMYLFYLVNLNLSVCYSQPILCGCLLSSCCAACWFRPSVRHFWHYNLFHVTGMYIKPIIYRLIRTKPWLSSHLTFLWPLWPWFFSNRQIFWLTDSLNNVLCITLKFIPCIYFTNRSDALEMGAHRPKSRSRRPNWPTILTFFFNKRNIWKTVLDS